MTSNDERTPTIERPILLGIGGVSSVQELLDWLKRVAEAGFDGVEVALPTRAGNRVTGATQGLQDVFTAWARANPPVIAVAGRGLPANVDAAIDAVKSLLEQATVMGARCLNLTIPPLLGFAPAGSGFDDSGFERYQEALNFAYSLLYSLRFESEAAGVALAVEAGAGGILLSPVELRELIDEANSWSVGACVDVGLMARFASPNDWLLTLNHRVHSVRIPQEVPTDPSKRASAVRTVDFSAIGDTLDEIGFTGPIIVDSQGESVVDW